LAETGDVTQRSNEEWLADLQGPGREAALADLRALLQRGLTYALSGRPGVDEGTIEDFCQDTLIKILDNLHTFRGESRFTTWAQKIAVNTAFTELRRRRWQNVSLNGIVEERDGDWSPHFLTDRAFGPEQRATQQILLTTVQRLINQELTKKQRQALTAAVLQQVPLDEIARRMDTNRNALYKLLHDARKRLKERMLEEGLSPDDVLAAFEKQ
jgi:RNA polymerase sigma-70 factor (ECF subfamily)